MTTDIASARAVRPGAPAPPLELPLAGGGMFRLADAAPRLFTMLVFNRGLHCPVCRAQLSELDRRFDELAEKGIDVVSISGESEQRASQMRDEWKIDKVPLAYGLSEAQMREWGLFVSRGITADEPAVFNEPALFLISPDGSVYYESILSIPAEAPAWTTCSLASTTGPPTTTPRAAAPSRSQRGRRISRCETLNLFTVADGKIASMQTPHSDLRARPLLRTATLSAPPSGYGGEWPGRSARSRSAGTIESPIHWRLRRPTGTPEPSRRGRSTACGSPRSPPYAAGDAPAGTRPQPLSEDLMQPRGSADVIPRMLGLVTVYRAMPPQDLARRALGRPQAISETWGGARAPRTAAFGTKRAVLARWREFCADAKGGLRSVGQVYLLVATSRALTGPAATGTSDETSPRASLNRFRPNASARASVGGAPAADDQRKPRAGTGHSCASAIERSVTCSLRRALRHPSPRLLPQRQGPRMPVGSERGVLGDQLPAVLDGGRVDQPVRRIGRKGGWQRDSGLCDRRGDARGSHLAGEPLEPRPDRDRDEDSLVPGQPGQLEPRDRRHRELIGVVQRLGRRTADPLRFGGPPVHDVGVEQHGRHVTRGPRLPRS